MTGKKIDPTTPINIYPDDPLWHEGCDRMLEYWVKECLRVDYPFTTHSVRNGRIHISRNNPSRVTLTQFLDEPAWLPPKSAYEQVSNRYLVKDPKEPYRRHSADREWVSRQVGTIGQVRLRLNGVTVSLFPFRNTVPQVSFTHPDRGYTLWSPMQTFYEPGESALHNVMLEGHLKAIRRKTIGAWREY